MTFPDGRDANESKEKLCEVDKNILIATDGSELVLKAVEQDLTLAKALGARATALTVTESWTARRSHGHRGL
jgi:nucleotide-binding universal stress UspA family protein